MLTKFEDVRRRHKEAGTVPSRQEIVEMHKVVMESAINWAKEVWDELQSSTISNCWHHTSILGDGMVKLSVLFQTLHMDSTSIRFLTH
ncbi:hypothetical protein H310_02394 [Aphanomyces invadans]|uniref:DDE-1 domain-containing protein n=1 Tax=Aphanomyces invadans TaxID=157072 RepID=A0A024UNJ9_9STRA|nr:hypothetical protein H310_02394 [Aphanomyces invadans]ETW08016.1 hypothetical protein H310_02394 [Aphanomyces invadans]|eukprot:XP_008864109.1 hypothetical protein H310_02394 [Aphanomyces invadans]